MSTAYTKSPRGSIQVCSQPCVLKSVCYHFKLKWYFLKMSPCQRNHGNNVMKGLSDCRYNQQTAFKFISKWKCVAWCTCSFITIVGLVNKWLHIKKVYYWSEQQTICVDLAFRSISLVYHIHFQVMRCHCIEITCCFKSECQGLWLSECEGKKREASR